MSHQYDPAQLSIEIMVQEVRLMYLGTERFEQICQ